MNRNEHNIVTLLSQSQLLMVFFPFPEQQPCPKALWCPQLPWPCQGALLCPYRLQQLVPMSLHVAHWALVWKTASSIRVSAIGVQVAIYGIFSNLNAFVMSSLILVKV